MPYYMIGVIFIIASMTILLLLNLWIGRHHQLINYKDKKVINQLENGF